MQTKATDQAVATDMLKTAQRTLSAAREQLIDADQAVALAVSAVTMAEYAVGEFAPSDPPTG